MTVSLTPAFEKHRRYPDLESAEVEVPALLKRRDGAPVLYKGRLNSLIGRPSRGKTWVALLACKEALQSGSRAVWVDHEDSTATMSTRARVLGLSEVFQGADSRFGYVDGELARDKQGVKDALTWIQGGEDTGVVVIDAAFSGGCPSDGADVMPWYLRNVRPWQRAGLSVVLIDHVPKRSEHEGPEGGIGSQSKLAVVDGAVLGVKGTPWTRTKDGRIELSVHKDRPGAIGGIRDIAAVVLGQHREDGNGPYLKVDIVEPLSGSSAGSEKDVVETLLLRALEKAGEGGIRSQVAIRKAVAARDEHVDRGLDDLVEAGQVTKTRDGRAWTYRITPEGGRRLAEDIPA